MKRWPWHDPQIRFALQDLLAHGYSDYECARVLGWVFPKMRGISRKTVRTQADRLGFTRDLSGGRRVPEWLDRMLAREVLTPPRWLTRRGGFASAVVAAARRFGVPAEMIVGADRQRRGPRVTLARWEISRRLVCLAGGRPISRFSVSQCEIARMIGCHHTTIWHGLRQGHAHQVPA